ncbi:MarR family transcriptional regulator [Streptomyces sp. CAI-121]|uniref:MarR family transcriptional regulator n=1 Tax=unclassified Streptomyces TaxID=2593676 RepID=UPI001587BD9D|nr:MULTISPECIES: MarR family transcriptional regulator [unclassified Streptomyces]NUV67065.1 MarR family transcriptional regulator [Streptomyces sp. CAI-121]NUW13183.1 MarR family transcriptional regulator [Streptomyces sp. CAI-68]
MATQHHSSALPVPAVSPAYPMAKPGYGKRSAPGQQPRTRDDFALLPTRERYIAGFIDHLPDGAEMGIKQLAKQLPLYGQQAISTALNALSVAGHLRRIRCPVGAGDECRWVSRTFWSRTARDNEWWNTYLATETATQTAAPAATPEASAPDTAPPPPWVPTEEPPPPARPENPPSAEQDSAPTAVPQQRTPPQAPAAEPAPPTREATPSPAYLALARLGRDDHRLGLSADDCTALEPLATQWLDRGVTLDYLTNALTAGLPAQVDSPIGLIRRRLTDKLPPQLPATTPNTPTDTPTPTRRLLVECTDCGRPGQPEALPDGLCRPCHTTHSTSGQPSPDPTQIAAVKTHMANLRTLLKPV